MRFLKKTLKGILIVLLLIIGSVGFILVKEYIEKYNVLLKNRLSTKEKILDLIKWLKEFKEDVALSCFCSKDSFCHRHLAIKFLSNLREKIITEKPCFLSKEDLDFLKSLTMEGELQI